MKVINLQFLKREKKAREFLGIKRDNPNINYLGVIILVTFIGGTGDAF